ncbi:glycogen synthase [Sphingomonas metalli]|uniref:Glycogen synthase n=1 Tax=Sphingomonas metalli TaxID=1779358 RepID=A0A916T1H2_9SPHN|nr:glycogen synthase [Sphingomonas metalli]
MKILFGTGRIKNVTPILSVASEAYPLVKTGGLADVVGALPDALAPHGFETTTLLPGYAALADLVAEGEPVHHWADLFGSDARLVAARLGEHPLLILDAPALFQRPGGPYADPSGRDWDDNWRRFAALARAGAELAGGRIAGQRFALLHAHDWQAGLAPAYVRAFGQQAKTVMTVHNIAFQGRFDRAHFAALGLPDWMNSIHGVEYYDALGYLKAGLQAADAITTVSPTYAREIREPQFGMGLEGLIAARAASVSGIVNGIDPAVWSPASDPALPARYDAVTLDARAANRAAVEPNFGLASGSGPIFTVISRLTWQKGMDVLAAILDDLVATGARLALLGSGDRTLEDAFRAAADRHPGRIGVRIGYDERLSHLLQGGADAILIPSRFEPCGLTQLYGLAYGCVPVVARTGGLADTVIDANEAALAAGVATGIVHDGVTPESCLHAIARAVALYADAERWRQIQRNGMAADFSWDESGRRYADLYHSLLEQP